ncbi:hypothetical protein WS105_0623 [Weissella ceti]|uniref:phBC6A51 family helix-turn-helix protein n=1 Tax=Weissella ceti TaxID=759620 RepID=UPI0004F73815|nr:phBC6A51 family helix-turn-helix protein [Weissella ceti]AIM64213.1 hypothetical protein WS105_0623 [Weissella ceti]
MTLTKKQLRAVELVFEGNMKNIEIANELNITDRTLYKWKNIPDFKDAIVEMGNSMITSNAGKLMKNMENLAFNGRGDYVKLQATQFLLDKSGIGENQELDINLKPVEIIDDIKRQADK